MRAVQGSSFLTISLFWRGFLATCTCTVVLHMLAFMKARHLPVHKPNMNSQDTVYAACCATVQERSPAGVCRPNVSRHLI